MFRGKLWVVMTFLLISLVNAELISVEPCTGEITITEDATNIYIDSPCFYVNFDKNYNNDIDFYDKYNDDYFDLKLYSLQDVNDAQTNQQNTDTFASMSLTASIEDDSVVYTSSDNLVRLIYKVDGQKIKANMEILNWTSNYATGQLKLRTRVHKESTAESHFASLPAIVDGIEQPLIYESEVQGVNEFILQTLYIGNNFDYLEIDPLYQVDYSPVPASLLYHGLAQTFANSDFPTLVDITTGLSDNLSSTQYTTQLAGAYDENQTPQTIPDAVLLHHFNNDADESSTLFKDRSGFGNDGTCNGTACPTYVDSLFTKGVSHDGNNDEIYFGNDSSLNTFDNDITFGVWFKPEGTYTQWMMPIYKGNSGWGDWGIGLNIDDGWALIKMANSTGGGTWCGHYGASLYDIGEWVFFAGTYDGTTTTLYVQGLDDDEMFNKSCQFLSGSILNNYASPLKTNSFGLELQGVIDEMFVINDSLSKTEIEDLYASTARNLNRGRVISSSFSETYDSDFEYYINVDIETPGNHTLFVYAYNSSDDISNQYVTKDLYGTGEFNINVTGLMDYMTNTQSLSFTQFRIFTDFGKNISQVLLRKEVNDTTAPNITNCKVLNSDTMNPQTSFNCLDGIRYECTIVDNVDVDDVLFQIDGTNVTAMQDDDTFYYEFYPDIDTTLTTYTLEYVYAEDIGGRESSSNEDIDANFTCEFDDYIDISHTPVFDVIGITNTSAVVRWTTSNQAYSQVDYGLSPTALTNESDSIVLTTNHLVALNDLIPNTTYYYNVTSWVNPTQTLGTFNFTTFVQQCNPNWVQYNDTCLTNDTFLRYYLDSNGCGSTIGLPSDNGSYFPCNYCTQNINPQYTPCIWNGTGYYWNKSYIDSNYFSCCVFTGLVTDCSILSSPYNLTIYEECNILQEDFNLNLGDVAKFGIDLVNKDKVYGRLYINTSVPYDCISYVKDTFGMILQTNPVYEQRTTSALSIASKSYENREVFTTNNGLANVYWTKENLIIDGRNYVFGVECSNGSEHKISEKSIVVLYEDVNVGGTRMAYLSDNAFGIMAILIIIVVVGLVIFFVYGVITR